MGFSIPESGEGDINGQGWMVWRMLMNYGGLGWGKNVGFFFGKGVKGVWV